MGRTVEVCVDFTGLVLTTQKFALLLWLNAKLYVHNVLFSQGILNIAATGFKANLHLAHTVIALKLGGAIIEEEAVIIERVALWTKECDEPTAQCLTAQSFTLFKIHSAKSVDDIVCTSLTLLILQETFPRRQTGQSHGLTG